MRKNSKKLVLAVLAGTLAIGGAFTGYAANLGSGQWCTGTGADAAKYWFAVSPDGTNFLANTWHWVKDSDGNVYCYYFDQNGWVVTNTTVDGSTVDANGRWVDDAGAPQTAAETEKDFYTHSNTFLSSTGSTDSTGSTGSAGATGTTTPTTNNTSTSSSRNSVVKGSGRGDLPSTGAEVDALGYSVSSVSGQTITNNWANFTLSLSSVSKQIEAGTTDNGVDFYVNDGAELTGRFIPLDKYQSGNTDLNAFISSFLADKKEGATGGSLQGDTQLGDFTFKTVAINEPNPTVTITNYVYFRVVDGSNYAQVISVDRNGESQTFQTALGTLKRIQ